MRHSRIVLSLSVGYATVLLGASLAQTGLASTLQTQDPQPTTSTPSPQSTPTPAPTPAKATKKVWTNEDVGGLSGSVSVVGNPKNSGKAGSDKPADAQYISNTRKELQKLRGQLDDTTKELTDLQDFQSGKAPSSSGYPISKGYGRIPVDQQIASLEAKKKDLEGRIDALLDDARKKGVLPGDLR